MRVGTLLAAPGMEERIAAVVRRLEVDVAPLAVMLTERIREKGYAWEDVNVEKLKSLLCVPTPRKAGGVVKNKPSTGIVFRRFESRGPNEHLPRTESPRVNEPSP